MRRAAVLLLAVGCVAAPAAAATAASSTPQQTVVRFLAPKSPADGCAQLTARYRRELDRRYGPCTTAITANPKATHIRFSNVQLRGSHATLDVHYRAGGHALAETFVLLRQSGRWRIDGARPL